MTRGADEMENEGKVKHKKIYTEEGLDRGTKRKCERKNKIMNCIRKKDQKRRR